MVSILKVEHSGGICYFTGSMGLIIFTVAAVFPPGTVYSNYVYVIQCLCICCQVCKVLKCPTGPSRTQHMWCYVMRLLIQLLKVYSLIT